MDSEARSCAAISVSFGQMGVRPVPDEDEGGLIHDWQRYKRMDFYCCEPGGVSFGCPETQFACHDDGYANNMFAYAGFEFARDTDRLIAPVAKKTDMSFSGHLGTSLTGIGRSLCLAHGVSINDGRYWAA